MTSIEILQAYPLGTVDVVWASNPLQRLGKVVGLSTSCIEVAHAHGSTFYSPDELLPELHSFDQLCTRLEDGTVPAEVVAKMLLAQVVDALDWNNVISNEDEDRVEIQVPIAGRYLWLLHIQPDYTITCYNSSGIEKEVTAWKATDYLRSKHFAVGLTADQYIRKGQPNG